MREKAGIKYRCRVGGIAVAFFVMASLFSPLSDSINENTNPISLKTPVETPTHIPVFPLRIDSNSDFSVYGFDGNGTEDNPWVLRNYDINGTDYGYCIYIGNTTDYFVVKDCEMYGSTEIYASPYFSGSGLILFNATNGSVEKNCIHSNSGQGIALHGTNDIMISGNDIFENNIGIAINPVLGSDTPPYDVVFALDTSGSMSGADMQNLKDATKDIIGELTEKDRAAIFTFDGGGNEVARPLLREPYAYMTQANRDSFNATVDTFIDNGFTPFYDTMGAAIEYTQANILPDRLEFVIGMTDGESNSDDNYTPNANWGDIVAPDNEYSNQPPHPTKGLLSPPCMVYTIGLGISHDPSYPMAPDWSRTPPDDPPYYLEYDVWNSADSSPAPLHDAGGKYGEDPVTGEDFVGHYYYVTDSDQLPDIFNEIIVEIGLIGENCSIVNASTVHESVDNIIADNTISRNIEAGIHLESSENNVVYHNKFIDNAAQAIDNGSNFWDNGYPSGGNYWSDYLGVDQYNGPYQDQRGSDGIGDTPYLFNSSQDNYPLLSPFNYTEYELPLQQGWNLISFPVRQENYSMDVTLESIAGKWDRIRTYDAFDPDHWKSYSIHRPDALNDLNSMGQLKAYWINITEQNVILTVRGDLFGNPLSIPLKAGWNLVCYPTLNETMTVGNALWGTGADRVEIFDPLAPYQISEVGPTYIMRPGEGYWVHVPVDTV